MESDTGSEESREHDNKDHEVLDHEVDQPEAQEQVVLEISKIDSTNPVAIVSQSSLEENDYPEQGDINYETNGNLLGEAEEEYQEEVMSFGIDTSEQDWPTYGELGNNLEQFSLDHETSGNGVIEVGMDYEISEKDSGDTGTDETNQNILRRQHHINSIQGASDPFQCAQEEVLISQMDFLLSM